MALERENFKYQLVSIDIMNSQVNIRFPVKLLKEATKYSKNMGYANLQDFVREVVREKLFPETLELSDWAKNELEKARQQSRDTYVDLDDLRDNIRK